MRTITYHIANATDAGVGVLATDKPDPNAGGACHEYTIEAGDDRLDIRFQHGPVKEVGRNGITEASLLAVLIDRYEHFQKGPFANELNETTLEHLRMALKAQHARTRSREQRGVEGLSLE